MKWILLFVGFLFAYADIKAQNNRTEKAFSVGYTYHYGLIIPKTPYLNYLVKDKITAFEFRLGHKPNPQKDWINQYAVKEVGLAYYHGTLGNDDVLGKVNSFYPYITFRLKSWHNIEINSSVGLGLAIMSKHFDPTENYSNKLIGSVHNAHVNLSLNMAYSISNFKLNTGLFFSHFSNGATKQPNHGINFITSTLGLSYNFGKKIYPATFSITYPKLKNEFTIVSNHAWKETSVNDPHLYYISSLSLGYNWGLNSKQRLGGGIDIFYDESINRGGWDLDPKNDWKHRFYQGVFISHDLVFNRFTFIAQLGFYTYYKSKPASSITYNRLGLRYKINKHCLINFGLKTYMGQSDYIEMGIGYYLNKKKRNEKA